MTASNTRTTTTLRSFRNRPCTIALCRGCCCGTRRKRPDTDHEGQLRRLRKAAEASPGRFTVLTTDCLGPCAQANIVVLRPSSEGRRRGGRAAWISEVLTEDCVEAVVDWATAGGPGMAPAPGALSSHLIDPPREASRRSGRKRR